MSDDLPNYRQPFRLTDIRLAEATVTSRIYEQKLHVWTYPRRGKENLHDEALEEYNRFNTLQKELKHTFGITSDKPIIEYLRNATYESLTEETKERVDAALDNPNPLPGIELTDFLPYLLVAKLKEGRRAERMQGLEGICKKLAVAVRRTSLDLGTIKRLEQLTLQVVPKKLRQKIRDELRRPNNGDEAHLRDIVTNETAYAGLEKLFKVKR